MEVGVWGGEGGEGEGGSALGPLVEILLNKKKEQTTHRWMEIIS